MSYRAQIMHFSAGFHRNSVQIHAQKETNVTETATEGIFFRIAFLIKESVNVKLLLSFNQYTRV